MFLRPICFQLGEGCCRKKRSPTTASSAAPGSHWSGPMLCQSCDSVSECGLCMSRQSCTRGNQPSSLSVSLRDSTARSTVARTVSCAVYQFRKHTRATFVGAGNTTSMHTLPGRFPAAE